MPPQTEAVTRHLQRAKAPVGRLWSWFAKPVPGLSDSQLKSMEKDLAYQAANNSWSPPAEMRELQKAQERLLELLRSRHAPQTMRMPRVQGMQGLRAVRNASVPNAASQPLAIAACPELLSQSQP